MVGQEGATLMHFAVRTASSQMIKILLLYNVDINLQDNVTIHSFSISTVKWYVHEHTCDLMSIFLRSLQYGWTPLHLAVQSRRTDIVRLLLKKGADKTLKNRVLVCFICYFELLIIFSGS